VMIMSMGAKGPLHLVVSSVAVKAILLEQEITRDVRS